MLVIACVLLATGMATESKLLSRRCAAFGACALMVKPMAMCRALGEVEDSTMRFLPAGERGGPPLTPSKAAGTEELEGARAVLGELRAAASEGRDLCAAEGFAKLEKSVSSGATNVAMTSGTDSYTVVNLKKTALGPVQLATGSECDDVQLRQAIESSAKAVDEILRIAKGESRGNE